MSKYAHAMIIGAGICWGLIGLFSTAFSNGGFSSIQITFIRNFIAAIFLFFYIVIKNRGALKFKLSDIWMFFGTGIISIIFFNICYFFTIKELCLSSAAILLYTAPFMVTLFAAAFFKEKFTAQKAIALLLAFPGCTLSVGAFSGNIKITFIGVIAGIGSGLGYALYTVFSRFALKKYSPNTVTFYTFTFAFISLFPFSSPAQMFERFSQKPVLIIFALLLGIISTLLPFALYTTGLRYVESSTASIMAFIEPLVATIIGFTVFKDTVTPLKIIGIILIFLGVLLLNIKRRATE